VTPIPTATAKSSQAFSTTSPVVDFKVSAAINAALCGRTTKIPTIREVALRDVSEKFASRRMQALGLTDEAREQFLGVMFFEGLLIRRLGEWALTAAGAAMLAKAAA
jgi:hypothetical protein